MNARTAWWNVATWVAGGAIALLAVVWSADVPMRIGLLLYSEQLVAAMIGFAVFGAFLRRPNDARPAPLEIACAIAGLVAGLWIACRYPVLQADVRGHATEGMVLGIVVIALAVEACRRGSGWSMPVIFGLFLAYALFGHHFAGIWQTKAIRFERLIAYLALDTSSLLGPTMIIVCTTVLVFMMFGRVLQACGGGEFFTDLSSALFGQFRGGTGKVEVVASAFFGSISGSAMANVMSTGIITIPNMKRAGYKPDDGGRGRGGVLDRRADRAAGDGRRGVSDGREPAGPLRRCGDRGHRPGRAVLLLGVRAGRLRVRGAAASAASRAASCRAPARCWARAGSSSCRSCCCSCSCSTTTCRPTRRCCGARSR